MAPSLYMILASPPVRAVLLTAEALGVELNKIEVNLLEGEHLKPEYLKINPQHTVPVLDDDGLIIADSHAINTYLVSKYGKDDSLYPKDLKKRAIVDQRLHFDSGNLFAKGAIISRGIIFDKESAIPPKLMAALEDAYQVAEKLLSNSKFIAGDQLTVADFSCVTSITCCNAFAPFSEQKYPNISAWIKRMETLPYYKKVMSVGLEKYYGIIEAIMGKNKY